MSLRGLENVNSTDLRAAAGAASRLEPILNVSDNNNFSAIRASYLPNVVDDFGFTDRNPTTASATIARNNAADHASAEAARTEPHISYAARDGVMNTPKTQDAGADVAPKDLTLADVADDADENQEMDKIPGLAAPESAPNTTESSPGLPVPPFPTDPITEACNSAPPNTGPYANPAAPICPGPGIRSGGTGRSLSETMGQ